VELIGTGWNPTLSNEDKVVYVFALQGDPETLTVGEPYETTYVPSTPVVHMSSPSSGLLRLDWDNSAAYYHIQGRNSLTEGEWDTMDTVYGRSEYSIPTDTPYSFFRVEARH
jgi:hypothetical protein